MNDSVWQEKTKILLAIVSSSLPVTDFFCFTWMAFCVSSILLRWFFSSNMRYVIMVVWDLFYGQVGSENIFPLSKINLFGGYRSWTYTGNSPSPSSRSSVSEGVSNMKNWMVGGGQPTGRQPTLVILDTDGRADAPCFGHAPLLPIARTSWSDGPGDRQRHETHGSRLAGGKKWAIEQQCRNVGY